MVEAITMPRSVAGGTAMRGRKHVRYSGLNLERLPRRLSEFAQEAMVEVALWWRRTRLPAHFTVRAYDQYGSREPDVFEERKGSRRKDGSIRPSKNYQIQGGRIRPLYSSGRLRAAALTGSFRVKATGAGRTLKVAGEFTGLPFYTYVKDGRSNNPHDKVAELTVVNEVEAAEMRDVFENEFTQALDRAGVEP